MDERAITLDVAGALAETVGEVHGVTEADLKAVAEHAPKLIDELKSNRPAYRDLPHRDRRGERWPDAEDFLDRSIKTAEKLAGRFENLIVLGIGGSALGLTALQTALSHPFHNVLPAEKRGGPRLFVIDNVDPTVFAALMTTLDPNKTLVSVISKSGETAETATQFLVARQVLREQLGNDYYKHILATTDGKDGTLLAIAREEGYETFVVPEGVGGRFSVLSPVGLLPAALVGIDIEALLAGAAVMDQRCDVAGLDENPALMGAAIQHILYNKGENISVMMPYSSQLRDVADWFRQLWAESLGKLTAGSDPVAGGVGPAPAKCVGTTDQHSQIQLYREGPNDKVITFIRPESFPESITIPPAFEDYPGLSYLGGHTMAELLLASQTATAYALAENGRPTVTINIPAVTPHAIGQVLQLLMIQTSFAGLMFGINAYDQPAVELGKKATFALLGRGGYEETAGAIRTFAGRKRRTV